ncbi:hypothetical protein CA13_39800 [Planctomycetes bacterium CA13]|uniref:Uncharacterized protein n=1 Tax=Novipirellula herctigrandis TaxID=2527986 RepID=A0A5C5Z626_9BACT|nr:hypothetical protein CA13_39800 [Planctomycetes bacterium CA13]
MSPPKQTKKLTMISPRFSIPTLAFVAILSVISFASGCSSESDLTSAIDSHAHRNTANLTMFEAAGESTTTPISYQPKYPDRVDPFRFPGDEMPNSERKSKSSVEKATQVEVLGFANLGEPKVILRTKKSTCALAVGETRDGVEVTDITPPAVKLKSGNLVWIVTMFDQEKN